jgi:putative hydrolase of the HAD superfamily
MEEQVWQELRPTRDRQSDAKRPELEAVVFDAGGTLVRLDFEWMSGMLAELGVAASVDDLRRAEVHGRRRYAALASRMPNTPALGLHPPLGSVAPTRAYFSGLLEAAGCRHPLLEEALERMQQRQVPPSLLWAQPMEGARAALDGITAEGLHACCVSNSDGRAEHHLKSFGVREGLDFVVDSQLVGVEKPDPRIFHRALRELGATARSTLHVGDLPVTDLEGARAAGLLGVLVDRAGRLDPSLGALPDLRSLPALARDGALPVPDSR